MVETKVFDADAHVIEPPSLYFELLEARFAERVRPDPTLGGHHGRLLPLLDGSPSFGGSEWMREVLRSDRGRDILVERFGDVAERGFDPPALLDALDRQGVTCAALFPSFSLHVPFGATVAPDLAAALARAYNRWIAEVAAAGRGRLLGVALAPLHDPAAAATEVRRAVEEDGVRAVMVRPNPVHGRSLTHPDHDAFFGLLEDLDAPMLLHEGLGGRHEFAGDRFDTWYARHAVCHPFEMMLALTGLCVDGVFDRHPRLRVAVLESGTGWLPWWLDRLDEHHELFGPSERGELARTPSDYFARHCVIGTETEDRFARATVDAVGADHVVWASDFPHLEARYPDGVAEFVARSGLPEADLQEVLWEAPCRLYGVDPVAMRS